MKINLSKAEEYVRHMLSVLTGTVQQEDPTRCKHASSRSFLHEVACPDGAMKGMTLVTWSWIDGHDGCWYIRIGEGTSTLAFSGQRWHMVRGSCVPFHEIDTPKRQKTFSGEQHHRPYIL